MNMLEHKVSWTVLKISILECSYNDTGLTLSFMAGSNMPYGLLYGTSSWIL